MPEHTKIVTLWPLKLFISVGEHGGTQAEGDKHCDLPSYQLGLRTGPRREPGLALGVIVTYSWKAAGRKGPGECWSGVAYHESTCVQVAKKANETWLVWSPRRG